jgi:tRNA pseudouridine32 synthase/23S rRNA pseudouridine746 synthase
MVTGVELPKVGSLVYENSHVVVVDKPAGWLSVPSRIGAKDERFCLGRVLEQQLELRLWPVHRLDAEVSGLLMFAKSAAAHRLLGAGFEHHQIHKTYLAWSTGRLPPDAKLGVAQRWQCRLLRGKKRAYLHAAGKESVTMATPLLCESGQTLWRLCPLTGRPHQLRVELARRDCPIVGDSLYGSTATWGCGIALRAIELDLADLVGRAELELPLRLSLALPGHEQSDHKQTGRAWRRAVASVPGHSTHTACPAEGNS